MGSSAAMWPIFRPKSSKGAGKKIVGQKNDMAEFLAKVAEFLHSESFIAEMMKKTQTTKKFAQHLHYCRKLLIKKNYQFDSYSKQASYENWNYLLGSYSKHS